MNKDELNANMNLLCGSHGVDFTEDSNEAFFFIEELEDKIPEDLRQEYWNMVDRSPIAYNWYGPADKRARALVEIFAQCAL